MRPQLMTAVLITIGLAAAPTFAAKGDKKAATSRPAKGDGTLVFKKLDANNDGKISRDEFEPISDKIVAKRQEAGGKKAEKAGDKVFDKADADHDGYLTPVEFATLAKRVQKLDASAATKPSARSAKA